MRSQNARTSLEHRLKVIIARLNETGASLDAFDDHAATQGASILPGAAWSARLTEDIVHWELIADGRVAARVFAPFRGGAWRYEVFAEQARPPATDTLVPRALMDALRRLAVQSAEERFSGSPAAARARSAQERLASAEDAADDARAAFRAAGETERMSRKAALDAALLDEAEARRESRAADIEATEARASQRPERRRRGPQG